MFTKKAKAYTNQLTELIKENKNIPVEDVFSHELLSVTIRNEAADFMEYIFPADQMGEENPDLPNFDSIIKYALANKEYKFEDDKNTNPLTFIVSRNAASFLASPGKKLNEFGNKDKEKRIFKYLRKFITTKEALNSMCAGNFARIFLSWYSRNPKEFGDEEEIKDFYNDKFSINKLIEFCVLNIKELCYAELLERFLTTEFEAEEQNKIRSKILYEILQKVRDIIGGKIENNEMDDDANSLSMYRFVNYSQKVKDQLQKSRPLTWKLQSIPVPGYLGSAFDKCGRPLNANEKVSTVDLIPIVENKIKWKEDEKKLFAYTLINVIWTATAESSTIFEFIQSQQPEKPFEERKRILEYLLFIGVFGYENIMVSSTAFRILDVVVNGDPKLDINPISKKDRLGSNDVDLIDFYADLVAFDTDSVSNLSIFSFPIFYDHVYSNLKAEQDSIVEYKFLDLKSKYINKEKKLRKYKTNKKGLTPFTFLIPVVMTEPPLSTDLCNSFFKVLGRLADERKELLSNLIDGIDDENELKETVEKAIKIDEFYLDFMTYKFEYPGLEGRYNIVELTEKLFPLSPHLYTKVDSKLDSELKQLNLDEKDKKTILINSAKAHPLINYSFVKITDMIMQLDAFLNSDSGSLIPLKNAQQIPNYVEQNNDGQTKLNEKSMDYLSIIQKSKENKFSAGPRDKNQEIDAS